jgi:hypothetical protein
MKMLLSCQEISGFRLLLKFYIPTPRFVDSNLGMTEVREMLNIVVNQHLFND